jgi:hypothetical protein
LQDCKGGCFDSASGAAGKVSVVDDQEYGPQDFFGLIEEMRVWRVVRTPEQIRQGMIADDGRGSGGSFDGPGIDKDHKGETLLLLLLLFLQLMMEVPLATVYIFLQQAGAATACPRLIMPCVHH